jgi:hypothetical protein
MARTVIIGPTGAHVRTVNLATGPSGATGLWEHCDYAATGPTGRFATIQIAATRDHRFKSIYCPGFTGTVTADGGGGGGGDNWILTAGAWMDTGVWIDTDNWKDS